MNRVKNSDVKQLRDYVQKFKINEEHCSSETMKIQIKNLKVIEKKISEVPKNDIRRYMSVREM